MPYVKSGLAQEVKELYKDLGVKTPDYKTVWVKPVSPGANVKLMTMLYMKMKYLMCVICV